MQNNINLDNYKVIIFDNYGTLWNGKAFYEGVLTMLEQLVQNGKIIVILSNTTQSSEDAIVSNEKKGLKQNIHYHEFITSGNYTNYILKQNNLHFKANDKPKYIYVYGDKKVSLFNETSYIIVDKSENADCVYVGIPYIDQAKVEKSDDKTIFKKASSPEKYNSLRIEPFVEELKQLQLLKLPMFVANPDLTAVEEDKDNLGEVNQVIRQGSIGQKYKELGGEVVEFGKPDKRIFEYVQNIILKNKFKHNQMLMVGDNLNTDIKGASSFGCDSVLIIQEGGLSKQEDLQHNNIKPTYVLKSISEML